MKKKRVLESERVEKVTPPRTDANAIGLRPSGLAIETARGASVPLPVVTVSVRHLPLVSLPFFPLPHGEPNDVHQEDPGQGVHGHAPALDKKPGSGRRQLAVQHGAAHEDAHGHEQQHEERVHGVAQPRPVPPRLLEEPARLQEGVGDLAAEQDGAALDTGLAQPQRQQDSQDAHGVVGQHDGSLRAEVDAPGHVEDEVAQAQHQGADLEGRVLRTYRNSTKMRIRNAHLPGVLLKASAVPPCLIYRASFCPHLGN